MKSIAYLKSLFEQCPQDPAISEHGKTYNYGELLKQVNKWEEELGHYQIDKNEVVFLCADFSFSSIALLIALFSKQCVVGLVNDKNKNSIEEIVSILPLRSEITVTSTGTVYFKAFTSHTKHPLITTLKQRNNPGFILFSSGTTGKSKAILHDAEIYLKNFFVPRKKTSMIAFLLLDHMGGFNSLFYTLFNLGHLLCVRTRTVQEVCMTIERYKVAALTTTPTFLNLMLLNNADQTYNLSSLTKINYGAEAMPFSTLNKLNERFKKVIFSQAYGLSELGVLPAKSSSSESLFFSLDQKVLQWRVVNGLLEIKQQASMLGYLNHPTPFTEEGWLKTNDAVIVKGNLIRVIGRQSELINVAGEKVYPTEIENILQNIPEIAEISVHAEPNALIGSIIVANVRLQEEKSSDDFKIIFYEFCKNNLPAYQIPRKLILINKHLHSERFKKIRLNPSINLNQ